MKPFRAEPIPYAVAAAFVAAHHRHLPIAPPSIQIRECWALVHGGRTHAVLMLGNPVAPALARDHVEVRRLASCGTWGACSCLYRLALWRAAERGRTLVTYTLASESGEASARPEPCRTARDAPTTIAGPVA